MKFCGVSLLFESDTRYCWLMGTYFIEGGFIFCVGLGLTHTVSKMLVCTFLGVGGFFFGCGVGTSSNMWNNLSTKIVNCTFMKYYKITYFVFGNKTHLLCMDIHVMVLQFIISVWLFCALFQSALTFS